MTPLSRPQMAWRAAQDLSDGAYVNLGIGLPTLVADHIPAGRELVFHSENGILGLGRAPTPEETDPDLINAGKGAASLLPGGCRLPAERGDGSFRPADEHFARGRALFPRRG